MIPQDMQDQFPGVTFNDSPRLADGERAMFVRILSKWAAKDCVRKLQELNPSAPAHLDRETKFLRVYAPDGDLVLSMLPTDDRCAHFICRLNKEVFQQ